MADELNWMQEYAASEVVEHADEGRLSRREMMVRLVAICGSAGAATTFLASCGSDSTTSTPTPTSPPAAGSSTPAGGTTPGTSAGAKTTPPPTAGGAGHLLSVASDDPDVEGKDVSFPGPASEIIGYVARPATSGERPGIVVIHEIFGLTEHIKDVARRLAKVGYLAVAPDLVSRAGGTSKAANIAGALTGAPVEDRVADLNAAVAFLEAQDDCNGKLGVVGFCFGGGMTLSLAGAQPKVLAAVPYYGPTPQPPSSVTSTKAAILAHYGETDARVNASIPDLEAALAGKTFEKQIHPGAGHAFNNDTGANYNEAEAVNAWTATVDWFGTHLS